MFDESEIGVADMIILARSDSAEPDLAALQQAQLPADGFAGGQSALWGDETWSCVAIDVLADSAEAAEKLGAVFAALEPGGEVDQETSVDDMTISFQSCSPFKA